MACGRVAVSTDCEKAWSAAQTWRSEGNLTSIDTGVLHEYVFFSY